MTSSRSRQDPVLSRLIPLPFALFLWGSLSLWESGLFLLGAFLFLRRPVLGALAAVALSTVSPSLRVLLLAMALYALLSPLLWHFFKLASRPSAALASLLASYSAFWLPLPATAFFAALLLFSLRGTRFPLAEEAMLSATLAGLCFLLALPLFYL